MSELALRYRDLVEDLKSHRFRSALERLAHWILTHSDYIGRSVSFKLPMEKKTLATLLGMRAENLSRSFAELTAYGAKIEGAHVTIIDRPALAALARYYQSADEAACQTKVDPAL